MRATVVVEIKSGSPLLIGPGVVRTNFKFAYYCFCSINSQQIFTLTVRICTLGCCRCR